ncbi:unnamed protein product [Parnassius apollo]|uniref:(apollo) hypothetical protein n=1 Tax=Parnassius apollo TaxID=110799 RepID=A0A8S3XMC4_PARAO|nr:unnamed protein product [Parnassius apollo]
MSWESKQASWRAMLEAVMSDNEDNVAVESDASIDDDYVEESDHDSMSEQNASSSEESEAEETETQERFFLAKDKITKWFKVKGRTAVRTRSQNIMSEAPGPKVELVKCVIMKIEFKYGGL